MKEIPCLTISAEYAARFSGMSSSQYMDQIIYLNDLQTTELYSGEYIVVPVYH